MKYLYNHSWIASGISLKLYTINKVISQIKKTLHCLLNFYNFLSGSLYFSLLKQKKTKSLQKVKSQITRLTKIFSLPFRILSKQIHCEDLLNTTAFFFLDPSFPRVGGKGWKSDIISVVLHKEHSSQSQKKKCAEDIVSPKVLGYVVIKPSGTHCIKNKKKKDTTNGSLDLVRYRLQLQDSPL